MKHKWLWLTGIACWSVTARAEVSLPALFGDEMVLQRKTQAPIWGWANPGEAVTVTGSWGASAKTITHADGTWAVKLDTPEAGGPFALTVEGKNSIELKDVLSGEVWFCSGQSNMQLQVNECRDADREIAQATHPKIRLFQVKRVPSRDPLDDAEGTWETCSPESVKGFSGAAYFYGRKLHQELDVPVGLILAAWGATTIEAWTPRKPQLEDPIVKQIMDNVGKRAHLYDAAKARERYEKALPAWERRFAAYKANGYKGAWPAKPKLQLHPQQNQHYPGNLYNGMVHPMMPFAIRGVIWYQGESNSKRAANYEVSLRRMIAAWREDWGQGAFPFYFVQLPNFRAPSSLPIEHEDWPIVRAAFLNTAKTVPNTGMAITIDLGDINAIHPKNKQDVGDRLARVALRKTYNKMDHAWTGPFYTGCHIEEGKATVSFENGNAPLAVRNGGRLHGFALADATGKQVHADAVIVDAHTVVVSSTEIPEPVSVFYAWANNPLRANLINQAGLPASPFRHGPMPEHREENLLAQLLPEEAKKYQLLYAFDPTRPRLQNKTKFIYENDNSRTLKGPFEKVAYFLALKEKTGGVQYAFVSMDPFSQNPKELGVPAKSVGKIFQQNVTGVEVKSNVPAVTTGFFDQGCNIEFWDCSYGPPNFAQVPHADDSSWDFGDRPNPDESPGYGSMQIHNHQAQQSIICFNRFAAFGTCDVGIGNSSGKSRDWTQTGSAKRFAGGELKVLILK